MSKCSASPLSERYVVDAILLLNERGCVKESDFYCFGSNYATAAKLGRRLVCLGLADTYAEIGGHVTRYYVITSYGKRVAKLLEEANYIIMGELREDEEVKEQYLQIQKR